MITPQQLAAYVTALSAAAKSAGIPALHVEAEGLKVSLTLPPAQQAPSPVELGEAEADAPYAHTGVAPPDLRAWRDMQKQLQSKAEAS